MTIPIPLRPWRELLAPDLEIIFLGFNPSLPSWRSGRYYANPGNQFYRLLHESGLTPRQLAPAEDDLLLSFGIGATDLVQLPSARAEQLSKRHLREGAGRLRERLAPLAPLAVCCNGAGVYEALFGARPSGWGPQAQRLDRAEVFVTPSTSGLANGLHAERRAAFAALASWRAQRRALGQEVQA